MVVFYPNVNQKNKITISIIWERNVSNTTFIEYKFKCVVQIKWHMKISHSKGPLPLYLNKMAVTNEDMFFFNWLDRMGTFMYWWPKEVFTLVRFQKDVGTVLSRVYPRKILMVLYKFYSFMAQLYILPLPRWQSSIEQIKIFKTKNLGFMYNIFIKQ